MRILFVTEEWQKQEILAVSQAGHHLVFQPHFPVQDQVAQFEAFYLLSCAGERSNEFFFQNKPVVINEVIETSKALNLPANFIRVNGWRGFLQRPLWEVVAADIAVAEKVLEAAGRKMIAVADTPGLVAARVISSIVNEAYFALDENISTREEIDMAMKLGTNYPFGPFEWAEKIGINNICTLLQKLAATDKRYSLAPNLLPEFLNENK